MGGCSPASAVQCRQCDAWKLQWTAVTCSALHWKTLHCTLLHCTAIHCIALHCSTLHNSALHRNAKHCALCSTSHCTRRTLWVTLSHTLKVHSYLHYLPLYITQSCKNLLSLDSKRWASSHFWGKILPQNALVIGFKIWEVGWVAVVQASPVLWESLRLQQSQSMGGRFWAAWFLMGPGGKSESNRSESCWSRYISFGIKKTRKAER